MSTSTTIAIDLRRVAHGTHLPIGQVQSVVQLLDAGNTVPFITRYRKDQTGGLDEEQIRDIQTRLARQRLLAERKQTILRSVESQGKLTQALAGEIEAADSIKRLEDLYLPFKPKKQTLATVARERGLEPLAEEILSGAESAANLDQRAADFVNPDRGVPTLADVMLGVGHILAEQFSELASLRQRLRKIVRHSGKLVSCRPADVDEKKAQGFRDYFEFSETLERVPPHRVLAINRGERAKLLRVKVEADLESLQAATDELLVPPAHEHAEFLRSCGRDALARLVFPSLEREVRRELTERAEAHAVEVFARNLRKLLLQPPVRGRRVLALDPGFKSGCKIAALDEFGKLLDHAVIHLVGKSEEAKTEGRAKLVDLIQRHQLTLVAIGNGTACRESEELIASILAEELHDQGIAYVVVNEAGASVYSTSPLGREEFPEYDAVLRGAISIGRRIQDPLSELVKIEPANLGVGLYQHDVKAKHLQSSLDAVVESCVNYVGVDVNTASPALLRYVSGLNQLTARRLYDYRTQHGPFRNREQLREVSGFGDATFVQAAGFLKISDGDQALDATWIHPESYLLAEQVLHRLSVSAAEVLQKETAAQIEQRAAELDLDGLAAEMHAGVLTLKDIITQVSRPGRDPREDLPPPIFKKGILKLDDLSTGMELAGTVLNVVDFGAFVDIGLHDTGLVHISQLANRFVRDPHDVVSVGDIVKVWVHDIDKARRRVSLTMIPPGTERPAPAHAPRKKGRGSQSAARHPGRGPGAAVAGPGQEGALGPDGQPLAGTPADAARSSEPAGSEFPRRGPRRGGGRPGRGGHEPHHAGGAVAEAHPSGGPETGHAGVARSSGRHGEQSGHQARRAKRDVYYGPGMAPEGEAQAAATPPPVARPKVLDRTPRPPSSRVQKPGRRGPGPGRSGQSGPPGQRGAAGRRPGGPAHGGAGEAAAAAGGAAPAVASKPKPLPDRKLTDEMKQGKAPLRTFGDLKQFLQLQQGTDEGEPGAPPPEEPHDQQSPPASPQRDSAALHAESQSAAPAPEALDLAVEG